VRSQLKTAVADDLGVISGDESAAKLRAFDEQVVRIEAKDPTLIQPPNAPALFQQLYEVYDVIVTPEEEPRETPALDDAQALRNVRRRVALQARRLSQAEEAKALGVSRGLASVIQGVDPFMRDVWGLPPNDDLDNPEVEDFQLFLRESATLPFEGREIQE
jgi:hypothetical protein